MLVGSEVFHYEKKINNQTLRKTLFILKPRDGLLDFAVFESVFVRYREKDGKYLFKVTSDPVVLRDQSMMVHLMSRKDIKLAAVDLVESSDR